jgi:quinoprotein glucose dehydrogenase
VRRRTYLTLAGLGTAGLAGCAGRRGGTTGSSTGDDTAAGSGTDADGTDTVTATATEPPVETDGYRVETVATGFDQPWSVTPLPDGPAMLVTELPGRLWLVDREGGDRRRVAGTPSVFARGQGGLLDVAIHPEYPAEPWVYLTYAVGDATNGTSTTRLGRGRLAVDGRDGPRLRGFEPLFTAEPYVQSTGHFGSRVGFGPDGFLYVTVGDRQFKDFGPNHVAQDLTNHLGTTIRLGADGSVPTDNPFVDADDAREEVYSYGHRNAQGLTVHPETGDVWQSEFGERDGDELNRIVAGGNYGWPVADEGCTYGSGDPIGVSHADREDVVAPAYTWPCGSGGFPPSGATFYDGDAFPDWRGDLFVGGLAAQYLGRFAVEGTSARPTGRLLADRGWRIRDVAVGPDDGRLYVAVDAGDAPIVRLVPT